jgi:uncharacterized protein
VTPSAPDVVVQLEREGPDELKFDKTEITVAPGQLVEITFSNTDTMQHNFLARHARITRAASGLAADEMMRVALMAWRSSTCRRWPKMLFASAAAESRRARRRSSSVRPRRPVSIPYVCTFPGHWRLMNGVLHVVRPRVSGGRGGRGGA